MNQTSSWFKFNMTSKITVVVVSPVPLEILSEESLISENTDDEFVMVNESFGCPDMSQPGSFATAVV